MIWLGVRWRRRGPLLFARPWRRSMEMPRPKPSYCALNIARCCGEPTATPMDEQAANCLPIHCGGVRSKPARRAILRLRADDVIGDDAFHRLEEELDWAELGAHAARAQ